MFFMGHSVQSSSVRSHFHTINNLENGTSDFGSVSVRYAHIISRVVTAVTVIEPLFPPQSPVINNNRTTDRVLNDDMIYLDEIAVLLCRQKSIFIELP